MAAGTRIRPREEKGGKLRFCSLLFPHGPPSHVPTRHPSPSRSFCGFCTACRRAMERSRGSEERQGFEGRGCTLRGRTRAALRAGPASASTVDPSHGRALHVRRASQSPRRVRNGASRRHSASWTPTRHVLLIVGRMPSASWSLKASSFLGPASYGD